MKISIIGYSGSGKSSLTKTLSEKLNIPYLHLDTVNLLGNWKERELSESIKIVSDFMKNDNWIIDGNYRKLKQVERLALSDIIIFMNFSRFDCLFRCIKRYFKYKGRTRESMANNCEEKLDWEFIKWILFEGRTREKIDAYEIQKKHYSHKWIQIDNQNELDHFLNHLEKYF